ncbi:MAG: S1C family serine protease [Candidatus Magasanikbacteria bacterium]
MTKTHKTILTSFLVLVAIFLLSSSTALAGVFENISNILSGSKKATSTPKKVDNKKTEKYKSFVGYEKAVTSAVSKSNPSVVAIAITKELRTMTQCQYDYELLPKEYQELFGDLKIQKPCPGKTKEKKVGGGSGFIVSSDGLIVTNKHVVQDKNAEYTVITNKGSKYKAEILAKDPAEDIAILDIDATGLNPAELGNSDKIKLGQTAIAIGNALAEFSNTVSVGVISGLSRNITATGGAFMERIRGVIQTDAAINQGNSGGPLLNLKGKVIGINTAVARGSENIGFAIPINRVKQDIKSVKKTGEIKTPFLGVRYIPITPKLAKKRDLPKERGALLRGTRGGPAILPGSSAAKAGLKPEDIILRVDGKKVTPKMPLGALIQQHRVGETINLKVFRDGRTINLQATLQERPSKL